MSGLASWLELDGHTLELDALVRAARDPRVEIRLAPEALERVAASRQRIETIAEEYRRAYQRWEGGGPTPAFDYGITTGFGEFKNIPIHPDDLEKLQCNILRSHSVGVGETHLDDDPGNDFPGEVVRAVMIIRLNTLLRGHSGVRIELVECLRSMLEQGIVPRVPLRGSVGSSGDLCPLSHVFVVLLGEGRYRVAKDPASLAAPKPALRSGAALPEDLGRAPVPPSFKEGLALTNGTTFSTALLALGVVDAEIAARVADVGSALSLEAVCGCARGLDPRVHQARGQLGQIDCAAHLRQLVRGSRLVEKAAAVQDVYSLRCAPQVHGASRDAITHARRVVEREINAATDNPLFFDQVPGDAPEHRPFDFEFRDNWPEGYDGAQRSGFSAGNFHGQPLGLAADFLAIAVAELANIAERRIQMLLDRHHNRNLPANLIPLRGVNSGYMISQYCAASLVSENKILCHPASVDSIPTAANSEDHVAMATHGARKLRSVLHNVHSVLAIELMVAAAAVEWRVVLGIDPRPVGSPPAVDHHTFLRRARQEAEVFADGVAEEGRPRIAEQLGQGSAAAYRAVRQRCEPMVEDRPLDGDVLALRQLIAWNAGVGGSALLETVAAELA